MPDNPVPREVVVGNFTYTLRPNVVHGDGSRHDWLRALDGRGHKSSNAEVNALVDEIVRLRSESVR